LLEVAGLSVSFPRAGGMRRVVAITEVTGIESDTITLQDVFAFEVDVSSPGGPDGGSFKCTGLVPTFLPLHAVPPELRGTEDGRAQNRRVEPVRNRGTQDSIRAGERACPTRAQTLRTNVGQTLSAVNRAVLRE